jgi:hypothetical protein
MRFGGGFPFGGMGKYLLTLLILFFAQVVTMMKTLEASHSVVAEVKAASQKK